MTTVQRRTVVGRRRSPAQGAAIAGPPKWSHKRPDQFVVPLAAKLRPLRGRIDSRAMDYVSTRTQIRSSRKRSSAGRGLRVALATVRDLRSPPSRRSHMAIATTGLLRARCRGDASKGRSSRGARGDRVGVPGPWSSGHERNGGGGGLACGGRVHLFVEPVVEGPIRPAR